MRLDGHALGLLLRVGPQVELGVGGQDDRLEQRVDAGAVPRGHVDEHRLAAELLGHQPVLGQLAPDPLRVGALLVDLVDGYDDRHAGCLGVVQRLDRLRLHAVVGRDHQDHQVGGLGTAGTHGGERLVTRGVDEGDLAVLAVDHGVDLVGADVLGDAAGFVRHQVGVPDRVQQLGLAVVDVTHDGHDRRPGHQVSVLALVLAELDVERLQQLPVLFLRGDHLDVVVELGAEQLQRLVVDRLGGGDHLAEVEHHLHERGRVDADLVREVAQRGAPGQPDGLAVAARDRHAADRRRLHVVELLTALLLRLAAARRASAWPAEGACSAAAPAATGPGPGRSHSWPGAAAGTAARAARTAAGTTARATGTAAGTTAATAAGARACTGTRGAAVAAAARAAAGAGGEAAAADRPGRHAARAGTRATRTGTTRPGRLTAGTWPASRARATGAV